MIEDYASRVAEMNCSQCRQENPEHARFCLACGARLSLQCSRCGVQLSSRARFCTDCGEPVAGGPAAATPAAEPLIPAPAAQARFAVPDAYTPRHLAEKILTSRAALQGERKQITVLFADVKGSMELLADRDPEEARAILDPVLELMMEAVHRYEGTVNQVMGDGIMALFGAPLAQEDHAVRACYTALRMQAGIARHAHAPGGGHRPRAEIRIGLNSGEVVVGSIGSDLRMDYTAVGQTTHLAARMEQMATPGSILMTGDVMRLAQGYVVATPLGPRVVAGVPEPIETYVLTGASDARSRLQAATARGLTRYIGRSAEMARLRQALSHARAGHGQVVAIVGEPGVGKSRLCVEVSGIDPAGEWRVLESTALSFGVGSPYLPIVDMLRLHFQLEAEDDAVKIREKVHGKILSLAPALDDALTPLLSLLDVDEEDAEWQRLDPVRRRLRTLDAVRRLLLVESRAHPLMLIFDNVHWIDGETHALLDALVDSLPTARILLLLTYRPGYQHAWGRKSYFEEVRLAALAPEPSEALLDALLGVDDSVTPLKRVLIERTGGNPLFIEESVRALVDMKCLAGDPGGFRLERMPGTVQIPATARAMIAARIDRLEAEDKRVLQAASVIGRDIPFTLLEAVVDAPAEELAAGIGRLQAGEFLYEQRLFPDLEYTFRHALTQEVAYQTLVRATREHYHARVATALETRFPAIADTQPERLAAHYTEAGRAREAIGYWRSAAERALQRSANREAIGHLTRALALVERLADPRERVEQELALQLAIRAPLVALRGYTAPEVERACSRARELCQQAGDLPHLVDALLGLQLYYLVRAQLGTAYEIAQSLQRQAEAAGDTAAAARTGPAVGLIQYFMGDLVASRATLEHSLDGGVPEIGVVFTTHPRQSALTYLGFTLCLLGYPDQALARIHGGMAFADGLAHPFSRAYGQFYAAMLHHLRGEWALAGERADQVIAVATEHGFPHWATLGSIVQAAARACLSPSPAAIEQVERGVASLAKTGADLARPRYLGLLAEAHLHLGQMEAGLRAADAALVAAAGTDERYFEAELHRLRGALLLGGPDPDHAGAEDAFQRALAIARRQQARFLELRAARSLSALWAAAGRRADARALLDGIYRWFTEGFDTPDLRSARAELDQLA